MADNETAVNHMLIQAGCKAEYDALEFNHKAELSRAGSANQVIWHNHQPSFDPTRLQNQVTIVQSNASHGFFRLSAQ